MDDFLNASAASLSMENNNENESQRGEVKNGNDNENDNENEIIEQLNNELAVHQSEISDLKSQIKLIANRVKDNTPGQSESQDIEPPPPHY